MRNSQRAVGGLLAGIVVLFVGAAIWIKIAAPAPPELSGERVTRTYDFTDFEGVEVSGQWRVTIERGDARQVVVTMPTEIVENVEVQLSGDGRDVDLEAPWWIGEIDGDTALEATITMPALESLDIEGTSIVRFSGFEGRTLSLDVSAAGDIRGTASRFDLLMLDANGAVNIDLGDVPVTDAEVDISGAGNVTLRMAGGRLTGDLTGAASLNYYGTVIEESVDKSGLVSVRRRD
jgi:hypothetical protein